MEQYIIIYNLTRNTTDTGSRDYETGIHAINSTDAAQKFEDRYPNAKIQGVAIEIDIDGEKYKEFHTYEATKKEKMEMKMKRRPRRRRRRKKY